VSSINQNRCEGVTAQLAANMLNEGLNTGPGAAAGEGQISMTKELVLAAFLIGVGLCVAGASTHLYQAVARQQAMLRYDGNTFLQSVGHLGMSFVCGPYIMLQLGWSHEKDGTISMTSALVSAVVAFGWAFITGLLFVGFYVAVRF
jgi:hypothetical protein